MHNLKIISLIGISFLIAISFSSKLYALDSLYLGQKLPGMTPELFLPEIFLKGTHSGPTFSPDGTEVYWSRYYTPEGSRSRTQQIFHSQFSGSQWSSPKLAPFSGTFSDGGPFLTNNGTRLFFYSNRPAEPGGEPSDEYISDIWFIDKNENGWGKPQRFPYNTDQHEGMATVSDDGTIFFQSNQSPTSGVFDIFFSEYHDGAYSKPINMGKNINCRNINFSPFIAPDKSYLIVAYNNNSPNNGLHIAFKKQDETWTKPVNMGDEINLTSVQRFPALSPDEKYLFFVRGGSNGGVFWVDAKIIYELRLKELE